MKVIDPTARAFLNETSTRICALFEIVTPAGVSYRATDHDTDLVSGGNTYVAHGFELRSLEATDTLAVDSFEVEGWFRDDFITLDDVIMGRVSYSRVLIWLAFWDAPETVIPWLKGWLGNFAREGERYSVEVRGLKQAFAQVTGRVYGKSCDADLGDDRCLVDLSLWRESDIVSSVQHTRYRFGSVLTTQADGWFKYGELRFTTGDNAGLSFEVEKYTQSERAFSLWHGTPKAIQVGDQFTVHRGCDKQFGTCRDVFGNVQRYQGFPHLPGIDKVLEYKGE